MPLSVSIVIGVLIVVGGVSFCWPLAVGKAISDFYRKYPIIRLAPAKQFNISPVYVRLLGLVLVLVGGASILTI